MLETIGGIGTAWGSSLQSSPSRSKEPMLAVNTSSRGGGSLFRGSALITSNGVSLGLGREKAQMGLDLPSDPHSCQTIVSKSELNHTLRQLLYYPNNSRQTLATWANAK